MNRLSRGALFDLVWTEPIRIVAGRFGISDVALGKVCRRHDVPLPPRGYWARVRSGARVDRPALPPRDFGIPEIVSVVALPRHEPRMRDEVLMVSEIPPPPEFAETIPELIERACRRVGKVTLVRNWARVHPAIQRLLDADEARRQAQAGSKYVSYFDRLLFDSPYERRRLTLANALFLSLQKAGMRPSAQGRDPQHFDVQVGLSRVTFSIDHERATRQAYRSDTDMQRPASEPLCCKIDWHQGGADGLQLEWCDAPKDRIEGHLAEIAAALIVAGEVRYRNGEEWQHRRLVERKTSLIESARERRAAAEREASERIVRLERARVRRLRREAAALRTAQDIRAYVQSVLDIVRSDDLSVAAADIERWTAWAHSQADRIDPVRSQAFFKGLRSSSDEEEE